MSQVDAEAKATKVTKIGKAVLIGGAAIVAGYAAYKIGSNAVDSGSLTALKNSAVDFARDESRSQANMKTYSDVMSKLVPNINPGYGATGTTQNCKRCTYAYILNRKGYNVKATKSKWGTGQTDLGTYNAKKHYTTTKITNFAPVAEVQIARDAFKESLDNSLGREKQLNLNSTTSKFRDLERSKIDTSSLSWMPTGSMGEVQVYWKNGSGHSVAWEKFSDGVRIIDCQNGKGYTMSEFKKKYGKYTESMEAYRLDDVELDMDQLKRWCENA